jgi:hypothetical protein
MVDVAAPVRRWWQEPSSGRCSGCEVRVHEELLIYCTTCDQPFCPLCIVVIRERLELSCHGCETQHPNVDAEDP